MSLGFTCPKSEGNYDTWYQWSVNKCLDTGVWITLVWVTGDPHPKKLHINRKFRENIGVKNRKNHENYYL